MEGWVDGWMDGWMDGWVNKENRRWNRIFTKQDPIKLNMLLLL
jgi:hypothetical protein